MSIFDSFASGFIQGAFGVSNAPSKKASSTNETDTRIQQASRMIDLSDIQPKKLPSPPPLSSSRDVTDLAKDVINAVSDAKSGNWPAAAADSIEVAKDVVDVSQDVWDSLVESRADAVKDGYAENSDIGFQ